MAHDIETAKELALLCRPLVTFLCGGYSLCVIILIGAIACSPSSDQQEDLDPPSHQYELSSKVNFGVMTITAFIAAIFCALFITATFTRNYLLCAPYMILHILIIMYSFAVFVVHLVFTNEHHPSLERLQAFGYHLVYYNGAFTVFISVIAFALLIYTLIPMWAFVNECRLIREDELREEEWRADAAAAPVDLTVLERQYQERRQSNPPVPYENLFVNENTQFPHSDPERRGSHGPIYEIRRTSSHHHRRRSKSVK